MEFLSAAASNSSGSGDGGGSTIFSGDSGSYSFFPPSDVSSPSIYLNLESYPSPSVDASPPDDDLVFSYIGKMLMEEEEEDYSVLGEQYKSLVAEAEQPFLDILSGSGPPSAVSGDGSNESWIGSGGIGFSGFSDGSNGGWAYDPIELQQLQVPPPKPQPPPPPSFEQLDVKAVASLVDESVLNSAFLKGMEEAKKFLPSTALLGDDVGAPNVVSPALPAPSSLGRRKNSLVEDDYFDIVQGRSSKHSHVAATEADEALIREMFDKMLRMGPQCFEDAVQELKDGMQEEAKLISSNGAGSKGRGRQRSRDVVDLRTLLIHCAQAVSTDDWRSANELLKQIRQHSSSTGDATQRLAQCFADGLQARIMGTGSMVYHALVAKRTTAVDMLKAYKIYMAACPFKKVSFHTSNQTILNIAKDAKKLHVIDFGIYYGFQWPCLIKRLSELPVKPSSVRITGIDNPEPGFQPEDRIKVTGRRLQDYAEQFGISFEYNSIAAKWETITVEQLEIRPDEVVIVNALYQFKSLMDESVVADSPRDMVLSTIARLKPRVFIHGVINGSYSAPFFVTRFREALFHCSAMFDMLDATVPRDNDGRLVIERDLFGRGILNVIACEGSERVERPETYKQWQVRNSRAGLRQVPLDREIVGEARKKVKEFYHKDFVVDEDHHWLLQGWKGRILYAISTWAPSEP